MSRSELAGVAVPVEVWCYARYSTDKQNDTSIEDQIAENTDFARGLGLPAPSPARKYSDAGKSGRRVNPDLARLLRDAATDTRPVRRVLVLWNINRLARNFFLSANKTWELWQTYGFRILTDLPIGSTLTDLTSRPSLRAARPTARRS